MQELKQKLARLDISSLAELQRCRNSNVILIAASVLEMEALPKLFEVLQTLPDNERLDVVLYGTGGEIVAARRFAILLHKYCRCLTFIVPFHCQSTMTALTLSGHQILAGDLALFSPIDPSLQSAEVGALASEDLRLFSEMGQEWFGIDSEEARSHLLHGIASSIFPTTLTSLYRANREVRDIANELLAMGSPDMVQQERCKIVQQLLQGYHSHSYNPTNDDMLQMGLPVIRDKNIEQLAWRIAQSLQTVHGGAARENLQEPRNDFILATDKTVWVRQQSPDAMAPKWSCIDLT